MSSTSCRNGNRLRAHARNRARLALNLKHFQTFWIHCQQECQLVTSSVTYHSTSDDVPPAFNREWGKFVPFEMQSQLTWIAWGKCEGLQKIVTLQSLEYNYRKSREDRK